MRLHKRGKSPSFLVNDYRARVMSADSIEQIVTGLSLLGTGIHQVWRIGKRIGELEGQVEILSSLVENNVELTERVGILRSRQDYLDKKIQALEKYN
jgi:hypothetical protein